MSGVYLSWYGQPMRYERNLGSKGEFALGQALLRTMTSRRACWPRAAATPSPVLTLSKTLRMSACEMNEKKIKRCSAVAQATEEAPAAVGREAR